jgi:glycosyltransferase involved in cell wall biosynthesis
MAASLSPSKLDVINPVTGLATLLAMPPPQRSGPLRLCSYGRFTEQKGLDFLIDAMRLVPPAIAQLRLVGLGPDEAKLRTRAEGLPHVHIEGPVPGPEVLLGEVDAVVMPSRFEAFGKVGTESRAAARPLILSDIDGLPTHALPGSRDLLVPPGDVAALAGRIIWLAGQDITALGEAHRATVIDAERHSLAAWHTLLTRLAPS